MAIRGFTKQICFKFVISNTNAHIQTLTEEGIKVLRNIIK